MSKLLVPLCLAILFASSEVMARDASYTYVDLSTQSGQIGVDPGRKQVVVGHHGIAADFCGSDSKFTCFATKEIVFSIPRDRALYRMGVGWEFGGHRFVINGADEEVLLVGQRMNILRIDSPTQQPPLQFWFDKSRGLVGIQGLESPTRRLFLLRERCGFGSGLKCR